MIDISISDKSLIKEQLQYYRKRADEYDEWFLRRGRYDQGVAENELWFKEIAALEKELDNFCPKGRILEIACGKGFWTQRLVKYSDDITALDASEEVIEINREKCLHRQPRYLVADIFDLKPETFYETVFFSFWLSHVPPDMFEYFWNLVKSILVKNGRVFFIDSSTTQKYYSKVHGFPNQSLDQYEVRRRINSGESYRIVKVRYKPDVLKIKLKDLGWRVSVFETQEHFIYGYGQPE